jgi:hypothetical protein
LGGGNFDHLGRFSASVLGQLDGTEIALELVDAVDGEREGAVGVAGNRGYDWGDRSKTNERRVHKPQRHHLLWVANKIQVGDALVICSAVITQEIVLLLAQ